MASMIWKVCLSGSIMPLIPIGRQTSGAGHDRVVVLPACPTLRYLRAELRRLFRLAPRAWRSRRSSRASVVSGQLTRHGLEEYVSDCVILLDHRVHQARSSTRRLRIVKYRGSIHGTNEYPFFIDEARIFRLARSLRVELDYVVSNGAVSDGRSGGSIEMLGGKGFFQGMISILLSGSAGTGKSSVAAHLAGAACRRGERCLFFSFEESPSQIMRNMKSIGLDLEPHVKRGCCNFIPRAPPFMAWRCTWSVCTSSSSN